MKLTAHKKIMILRLAVLCSAVGIAVLFIPSPSLDTKLQDAKKSCPSQTYSIEKDAVFFDIRRVDPSAQSVDQLGGEQVVDIVCGLEAANDSLNSNKRFYDATLGGLLILIVGPLLLGLIVWLYIYWIQSELKLRKRS